MNETNGRTLIIIDEQFEKIDGHPYEYNKSVAEIFRKHGYKIFIYGHKDLLPEICAELGARPGFTINTRAPIRKIPVAGAIIYRASFWKTYRQNLQAILEKHGSGSDTLYFFPNVYWYNILPLAQTLSRTKAIAGFLFRISIFDPVQLPKFMKSVTFSIIKRAVSLLKNRKNVCHFSDSEVIADEWMRTFGGEMKVLPIPHLHIREEVPMHAANDKLRMYLPGGMRIEKGAVLLTEAFEWLGANRPEILAKLELVTQFPPHDTVLAPYKERLAALQLKNIFLQYLSTEAYNHEMEMADIILIPYKVSEGYRARTSGILAEAIGASKPFITTDGTWMSAQAKKYDTGIVIQDGDAKALAEAVIAFANDGILYHDKAQKARKAWSETHSKQRFYDLLTACGDRH